MISPLLSFGAFAALCATLTLAANTPANAYSLARCTSVSVVSHRGLSDSNHTENTIRSFTNAYNKGGRIIEADVRATAERNWVFMHDSTINRTTRGSGSVLNKTVAELKRVRTNDGALGGIPTLVQGLSFLKARPALRMQIEIKTAAYNATLQTLLSQIDRYGVKDRVTIISFNKTTLLKVRALDPAVHTGLIVMDPVYPATAAKYGQILVLNKRNATAHHIAKLNNAGIRVYTWTVNKRSDWGEMVRNGSNGITTDNAPSMKSYCRRV